MLGRALLPHLGGHEVLGLTRSAANLELLRTLGATGAVCDVYQPGAFQRLAVAFAPELVVNFLTDLAAGPGAANTRIRLEGGPIVVAGATASGARKLAVESVAFALPGASGEAVAALERGAQDSGLASWVLRFGRLWGPGTWDATPPAAPSVHVEDAGRMAAELILSRTPGTYQLEGGPLSGSRR